MDSERLEEFHEVLATIMGRSPHEWVYLPSDEAWSLQSKSATLMSEEVPPDQEDAPDAGVPQLAKSNGLIQTVDVATLQDIVSNARMQRPLATPDDLFRAFRFYFERDAFIELG